MTFFFFSSGFASAGWAVVRTSAHPYHPYLSIVRFVTRIRLIWEPSRASPTRHLLSSLFNPHSPQRLPTNCRWSFNAPIILFPSYPTHFVAVTRGIFLTFQVLALRSITHFTYPLSRDRGHSLPRLLCRTRGHPASVPQPAPVASGNTGSRSSSFGCVDTCVLCVMTAQKNAPLIP